LAIWHINYTKVGSSKTYFETSDWVPQMPIP